MRYCRRFPTFLWREFLDTASMSVSTYHTNLAGKAGRIIPKYQFMNMYISKFLPVDRKNEPFSLMCPPSHATNRNDRAHQDSHNSFSGRNIQQHLYCTPSRIPARVENFTSLVQIEAFGPFQSIKEATVAVDPLILSRNPKSRSIFRSSALFDFHKELKSHRNQVEQDPSSLKPLRYHARRSYHPLLGFSRFIHSLNHPGAFH